MIEQYPDSISIIIPARYEQRVSSGNFEKKAVDTTLSFDCRAETGGAFEKGNNDGKEPAYSFTVYAEPVDEIIPEGAECTITKQGQTYRGNIKGSMNNEFNTVLWV